MTKVYTEKSNARRAARTQGLDPNQVWETEGGWALPLAATNEVLAEQTEASRLSHEPAPEPEPDKPAGPTPAEQMREVLDKTPPGEMPPLPPFLDVERNPRKKRTAGDTRAVKVAKERTDHRKPKGMSWEDFDAWMAREEAEKRAKTVERLNKLLESKGRPPVKEKRARAKRADKTNGAAPAARGYKGHAAGSAVEAVRMAYDKGGLAAALEAAKGVRYNPSTVRRLAEKWG